MLKGLVFWGLFAYGIFSLLVAGFDLAQKGDLARGESHRIAASAP